MKSVCTQVLIDEFGVTPSQAKTIVDELYAGADDLDIRFKFEESQRVLREGIQTELETVRVDGVATLEDALALYHGDNSLSFGSKNSDEVFINSQIEKMEARLLRDTGKLTRYQMHRLIDDPVFSEDFVKEVMNPGSTKTKGVAANFAKSYLRQRMSIELRANSHGAAIIPLDDPISALQWHNSESMIIEGKNTWVNFVHGLQKQEGALTLKELETVFEHFASPTRGMDDMFMEAPLMGSAKKNTDLGKRLTNKSFAPIKFRDGDAWLRYNSRFGHKSGVHAAVNSLRYQARLTLLTERLGPSPQSTHKAIKAKLKKSMGDKWTDTTDKKLDWAFDHLASDLPINTVPRLTSIVNAIQNLNIITRLGFSPLTAMTDVGISSVHLHYQGVPILKSYHHMITETIKGESEEMMTDIFRMLHAGNDGVLSYGMGRFQLGDSQPGALSGMVDSFVHATGLVQLTNRMRTAYVKMTSMHMADMASHTYSALPARYKQFLAEYGIDADDWKIISKHGKVTIADHISQPVGGNRNIELIPNEHYVLPEQLLNTAKNSKDKGLKKIAEKLSILYHTEARIAVPEAGLRTKSFMMAGQYQGTAVGQALRLMWQFKTPTVHMMLTLFPRMRLMGPSALMHTLPLVGIGYATLTAKDFFRGRTPRDPLSSTTFLESLAQAGILGQAGDILAKNFSYANMNIDEMLLGTTYSNFKDFTKVWGAVLSGEKGGFEAYNFLKQNMPFGNVFYAEAGMNYFIHDRIREVLNPGYTEGMNQWLTSKGQSRFLGYQP